MKSHKDGARFVRAMRSKTSTLNINAQKKYLKYYLLSYIICNKLVDSLDVPICYR